MKAAWLVCALLAAGCNEGRNLQHADLGSLSFDVPASWSSSAMTEHGLMSAVWAPRASDNPRKESIAVLRSERGPVVAAAGAATIERLLVEAQRALPDAQASRATPLTTRHGLAGFRIAVDYVPPGLNEHYHRIHVVLVDGSVLVHVLYTARTPDRDSVALETVLDSIREGRG